MPCFYAEYVAATLSSMYPMAVIGGHFGSAPSRAASPNEREQTIA